MQFDLCSCSWAKKENISWPRWEIQWLRLKIFSPNYIQGILSLNHCIEQIREDPCLRSRKKKWSGKKKKQTEEI
jgi:hypothetical protein